MTNIISILYKITIGSLSKDVTSHQRILAGKHDSRRRSTTRFSENVVVTETSYQMLEVYHFRSG